jgi:hypothetical protein
LGIFFPVLVFCNRKNLATLLTTDYLHKRLLHNAIAIPEIAHAFIFAFLQRRKSDNFFQYTIILPDVELSVAQALCQVSA